MPRQVSQWVGIRGIAVVTPTARSRGLRLDQGGCSNRAIDRRSMRGQGRAMLWHALLAPLLIMLACGPTSQPARQDGPSTQGAASPQSGRPRGAITMAVAWEPDQLGAKSTGGEAGSETRWMFNSPLTYVDPEGAGHPMLAQQIPSQDRGDWVIKPDGTMVTTYRLHQNIRWHDGVPLTANDFAFAYPVYIDPSLAFRSEIERRMTAVEAPDDYTIVITWSEPYAFANVLGIQELGPLPRHRLEEKYRTDKASFAFGDEWTTAYIGSGPFRLERWDAGVRIIARANEHWFQGSPRIDTVEVRFISDPNTVLANLLAGEIDFTSSPPLRVSEAMVARDQWAAGGAGYIKTWEQRLRYLEFQYREVPNWQRVVTDVQVRKALIHAIDREQLATVMTSGLGRVGDAWVRPADPIYPEVDRAIVKYPHDPRRAAAILEEAGWRRQPGGLLTGAAGQTLDIDVNSGSAEPQVPTIIADAWKAVGVNAGLDMVPAAQLADPRVRSGFAGARVGQRGPTMDGFHLISSKIPQPPRFNEANYGSFSDSEVDRLQNLAVTSFDETERRQAAIAMNKLLSELAAYAPLYYQSDVLVAKHRLSGPSRPGLNQSGVTWNIYAWEVSDGAR
jgi:peptide/nickel transport system substrate-binding protein